MARKEHIDILNQGVDVWNRWRDENPNEKPDLSGANLHKINLVSANLNDANLTKAHLHYADFNMANVRRACLCEADLFMAFLMTTDFTEADLTKAKLTQAECYMTDFSKADLSEADLSGAVLWAALLSGAKLLKTKMGETIFANIDLSVAKGVETIAHTFPSTIGIDTIHQSRGDIPKVFLRGAGVPDSMIAYTASVASDPRQFYSCFISYSSKDSTFAERLHADLQGRGVRCWFAPEHMKTGDRIRQTLDRSIRIHDKLLLILSKHSIGSDWVEKEVETAFEEERKRITTVLFPLRIDSSVMDTDQAWASDIRNTRHIIDFRRWEDLEAYQNALDRLMRDLKSAE